MRRRFLGDHSNEAKEEMRPRLLGNHSSEKVSKRFPQRS
jgi:hypothetical protein